MAEQLALIAPDLAQLCGEAAKRLAADMASVSAALDAAPQGSVEEHACGQARTAVRSAIRYLEWARDGCPGGPGR